MTETLGQIGTGVLAGTALGFMFFGGLKLTVDLMQTSPRPGLLALASLTIRMGLLAVALFLLAGHVGVAAVAATLPGIILVRYILVSTTGTRQ